MSIQATEVDGNTQKSDPEFTFLTSLVLCKCLSPSPTGELIEFSVTMQHAIENT